MNSTAIGISLSLSSIAGFFIGFFAFGGTTIGKWWGGVIGFFVFPALVSLITAPFFVTTK